MTGKILLLSAICLSALTVKASDVITTSDSISKQVSVTSEHYLQTLKPTYLTNVSEAANWGRNWFIEVKGGASAFLGSPIGCGDVFDRLSPALQVGIGKWFTPAVGGRVAYQGLSFKNGELESSSRWTTISFMLTFSTTLPLASTVMTSVCPDGTLYLSLV